MGWQLRLKDGSTAKTYSPRWEEGLCHTDMPSLSLPRCEQQQSILFRAPPEIRAQIFKLALSGTRCRWGFLPPKRPLTRVSKGGIYIVPDMDLPLLRVCQKTRAEIADSWLQEMLFFAEDHLSLVYFLDRNPNTRQRIRHICVREHPGGCPKLCEAEVPWDTAMDQMGTILDAAPLADALAALPGLQLDQLTVLSAGDPWHAYRSLDSFVTHGAFFRVLRFVTPHSLVLAEGTLLLRSRLCRASAVQRLEQPVSWDKAVKASDGENSGAGVELYRAAVSPKTRGLKRGHTADWEDDAESRRSFFDCEDDDDGNIDMYEAAAVEQAHTPSAQPLGGHKRLGSIDDDDSRYDGGSDDDEEDDDNSNDADDEDDTDSEVDTVITDYGDDTDDDVGTAITDDDNEAQMLVGSAHWPAAHLPFAVLKPQAREPWVQSFRPDGVLLHGLSSDGLPADAPPMHRGDLGRELLFVVHRSRAATRANKRRRLLSPAASGLCLRVKAQQLGADEEDYWGSGLCHKMEASSGGGSAGGDLARVVDPGKDKSPAGGVGASGLLTPPLEEMQAQQLDEAPWGAQDYINEFKFLYPFEGTAEDAKKNKTLLYAVRKDRYDDVDDFGTWGVFGRMDEFLSEDTKPRG